MCIRDSGSTGGIEVFDMNYNSIFTNSWGSNSETIPLAAGTYRIKINGQECVISFDGNSNRVTANNIELVTNISKQVVKLEWSANQTDETENFTIEKSIDGILFEPIKVITNNLDDSYFESQDEVSDVGNNYYRIKQQLTSGEVRYSSIHKENFHLDENSIILYPNPARDELWVDLGEFSTLEGHISVYNMLGQKITHKTLNHGERQLRFSVADYQSGLHYLTIETRNNHSITKRFVVEN